MEKLRGEREGRETEMGRDKGRKGGERGSVERAIEGMGRGRMGGGRGRIERQRWGEIGGEIEGREGG